MTHAHGLYRDTRASPSAEAEPHGGPARTVLGQQRSPLHRSGFTCSRPEFSPPYFSFAITTFGRHGRAPGLAGRGLLFNTRPESNNTTAPQEVQA